jgi:hypothetical protein
MAIMEVLAPQGDDELLALRLIPLEGPFFSLPAFPYPLGTRTLQVPALRIPVRPAPQEESAPLGESAPQGEDAAFREEAAYPEGLGFPPFPPGPEAGREIQQRSRALWEQGLRVEALAELRRNERDHPAGRSLAGLRRELEGTLGLEAEPDEIYAPRLLLIPALVLFLLLAALSLTLPAALLRVRSSGGEGGKRPLFRGWLPRGFCLVFSVAALLCLFRLSFGRRLTLNYGASSPRQALAREAALYRVPDDQGTEIARLREGQGLLVYEVRDGWAYAESRANGRAGWIRAGTYLIY